ncbi:hypothetical protein HS088_TW07G01325 [Tripterygium wilfordii]|uniref:Uncharacterized protein n=1 Tax=Tripterygium wilfordii TaxID=458696 RepID=A0A7J7DHE7_TRIWF|nr:hypothetical protein HS088_TW07G01325 [Tripterygium wilfordii]
MDFSIGTSSGSSLIENSGSEEDLQALTKRRRTISDPESARRSRLRKKKHLEDLMYQIGLVMVFQNGSDPTEPYESLNW